jgi:anti-anti-sigma regulatory factor
MAHIILSVNVKAVTEPVSVISLEGIITAAADTTMAEALEQAGSSGAQHIVLDFSGVSGIDSGGASALVKLWVLSMSRRISLSAAAMDGGLREIADLTQLAGVMPSFDDLSQALSALGAGEGTPSSGDTKRLEVTEESFPSVKRGSVLYWAKPVERLRVTKVSKSISGLNVEGRHPVGPVKGFGQMWEKTYEIRFSDAKKTPFEITAIAKENFVGFQPPQNHFYPSPAGIVAGETVLIRSAVMGIPIFTGVLVSYADDVSFTFLTPQGHPESGWVTFRVFREANETVCQIQGLARANDPIYEIAFRLHGAKFQEMTWKHVLGSLAKYLDVNVPVTMKKRCVAPNLQWSQIGNIRHNAQVWTLAYLLVWPIRRLVRIFKK